MNMCRWQTSILIMIYVKVYLAYRAISAGWGKEPRALGSGGNSALKAGMMLTLNYLKVRWRAIAACTDQKEGPIRLASPWPAEKPDLLSSWYPRIKDPWNLTLSEGGRRWSLIT